MVRPHALSLADAEALLVLSGKLGLSVLCEYCQLRIVSYYHVGELDFLRSHFLFYRNPVTELS